MRQVRCSRNRNGSIWHQRMAPGQRGLRVHHRSRHGPLLPLNTRTTVWQAYAAVAAAGYARAVIKSFTVITDPVTQRQIRRCQGQHERGARGALIPTISNLPAQSAERGADLAMAAGGRGEVEHGALLASQSGHQAGGGCQRLPEGDVCLRSASARESGGETTGAG